MSHAGKTGFVSKGTTGAENEIAIEDRAGGGGAAGAFDLDAGSW